MENENQVEKKKHTKRNLGIIGSVIVIALACVGIFIFDKDKDFVVATYDVIKDESTIYLNGKTITTVEGKAVVKSNMDRSVFYLQVDDDLYYVEDKELKKVDDGLQLLEIANHSTQALVKDVNGSIYIADKADLELVTDEAVSYVTISGDGKTFAYNVDSDAYWGTNSEDITKIENAFITFLSEDADIMYALEYDEDAVKKFLEFYGNNANVDSLLSDSVILAGRFFTYDKSGNKTLVSDLIYDFYGLNYDGTEIMFSSSEGTTILKDGNKKSILITDKVNSSDIYCKENDEDEKGLFKNIDDYAKCIVVHKEICYLVSGRYGLVEMSDDYNIVGISADFKRMIFYKYDDVDGKSLYMSDIRENAKSEKIADEVCEAVMTADGKEIYYVAKDNKEWKLYYYSTKSKEIDSVEGKSKLYLVGEDVYCINEDVYYLNKMKMTKIESIDDDMEFISDRMSKSTYLLYDDKLFLLDGHKVKNEKGKIIEKLTEEKSELSNNKKIEYIERVFEAKLPENVEIKDFEYSSSWGKEVDKYSKETFFAKLSIDESEYENILNQYEGVQYDMLEYSGYEDCSSWNKTCSIKSSEPQIKKWYHINTWYKEGDRYYTDSDGPILYRGEISEGYHVFITEVKDGVFNVCFYGCLGSSYLHY